MLFLHPRQEFFLFFSLSRVSESFSPKALETLPPSLQGEGESRLQSLFIVELASYLQELPRASKNSELCFLH